ncbi:kinesin-like protein KIN-7G [Cynara cardunculus var. scolymus]|uniref:kinesin-like protein KIN-7G n=1 Tax=Cynara cardunculus var. scolymus TaxID=59895 RepID=UPI000D63121A|nr:kinesin-like protein KIN-7G [Cynara cardunculus var. scolymus]
MNDVSDWECVADNTIVYKNVNLSVPERSMYPSAYTFDRVFGCDCSTRQVYQDAAKDVVLSVVGGINASIFAYGQTSSGKTYTMTGITEYTLADIYDYVQKHTERDFHLKFSAMEIYNESVRDLLSSDGYPLRLLDDPERGVIVENLTDEIVRDWDHVVELLSICEAQRQSGETSLNETSSRSHQIIRLTIESSPHNYIGRDSASTLISTVNFVDLAGSERASQSLTAGTRLKEGCHINRSLLTLGTVIRKLSKGRSGHIPFRDSKLTRILQSSLGGNSRTAIICTMSPARSHVEQSRNTLLFASCAKEVCTNAQVNTVISDKALVKHLQRELDRLENELRTPGSNQMISDITALLQERDHQIQKMQKQIEELTIERDDARSQVQDLLRLVVNNGNSLIRIGPDNYPRLRVQISPEPENYLPETSIVEDLRHSFDGSVRTLASSRYSPRRSESSFEENYIRVTEFDDTSPSNNTPLRPIRIAQLSECGSCHEWDEVDEKSNRTSQELCKEVCCIETEELTPKIYVQSYCLSPDANIRISSQAMFHDDESETHDVTSTKGEYMSPKSNENGEMKEHNRVAQPPLKEDREVETSLKEDGQLESSPLDKDNHLAEFPQSFKLPKSRSWSEGRHFTWLNKVENNTPPNGYEKYYTGRAQSFSIKSSTLSYGVASEKGSHSSMGTTDLNSNEAEKKISSDEEDSSITSATKEPAETRHDEEVEDTQITTMKRMKSVKSIGLDPIEDEFRTTSWALEFKRLQKELIKLWHDCNVSLVHRTYFILLFNGDPTDSIYMEVERRRLAFVKDMFNRVNLAVDDGQTITRASTEKSLRREREMLTKQMHKKLSEEERESMFLRWGIGLNTKYRRIQLANQLWSKVDDMDHVAESAVIVAKLVGLIRDPGHAPKEMFGLNFTASPSRKSYSFKRSLIPLL